MLLRINKTTPESLDPPKGQLPEGGSGKFPLPDASPRRGPSPPFQEVNPSVPAPQMTAQARSPSAVTRPVRRAATAAAPEKLDGHAGLEPEPARGFAHLLVVHQHDLVDLLADDREVELGAAARGQGVGGRGDAWQLDHGPGADALVERGRPHGLDADDAHRRADRLGGGGHSGDEPAAADRHQQQIDLRHLLEDLEADRRLAGNDCRIGERVDVGPALALRRVAGRPVGVIPDVALPHDPGAPALELLGFARRRVGRQVDHRRRAQPASSVRHAEAMVASGGGHQAAACLFGWQRQHLVRGSPGLEGTGHLERLQLEPELRGGHLPQQRLGAQQGCPADVRAQPFGGCPEVRKVEHGG